MREWLGALLDYDAQRHTELVAALARYLECGGASEETARRLSVQPQHAEVPAAADQGDLGSRPGRPETRFNLQLATRARQTLTALRSAGS